MRRGSPRCALRLNLLSEFDKTTVGLTHQSKYQIKMKSLLLILVVIAATNAQPAYFRENGSYHSVGANVGLNFPFPNLPELQLRTLNLPLPLPTLRQEFFNLPLPELRYTENVVRRPSTYHR